MHDPFKTFELMKTRLLSGVIIGMIVTLAAADLAAQEQDVVEIRSARTGQWNDPDIWERWNGSQWTPLLPNQYPGCRSLRYARVRVEHKVILPLGLDIHVTEVTAIKEEYLMVDGALTTDIAKNEVDPPLSDVPSPGEAPSKASGITIAPNPLLATKGGGQITVTFSVNDEYLPARLRLYNESGVMVREIKQWDRLVPGAYSVEAILSELPSGTYHLALEGPGMRRSEALTIVK
jgi:hypothetical protein